MTPRNSIQQARFKLKWVLSLFFFGFSVPVILLLRHTYNQLERDAFYQMRASSEGLIAQMDQRIWDLLRSEENRPFEDFSFFRVSGPNQNLLQVSPLSATPNQSPVPGVVGYFQFDPAGVFTTPYLPNENEGAQFYPGVGLSPGEINRRRDLERSLLQTLSLNDFAPIVSRLHLRSSVKPKSSSDLGNLTENLNVEEDKPTGALGKKISEMNLDSSLIIREESANGESTTVFRFRTKAPPESRKVQVNVPDSPIHGKMGRVQGMQALREESDHDHEPLAKPAPVKVKKYEAEMDPMQFAVLGSGEFVFFRKVWRAGQRYIQGFMVDRDRFLDGIVQATYYNSPISTQAALLVAYQGDLVRKFLPVGNHPNPHENPRVIQSDGRVIVARGHLNAPLNSLEMLFTVMDLPQGVGARVVNSLAVLMILVLIFGFWGVYRIGIRQIEIASQRSDFVSAVSHELKTPLTSIRMYSEMLRSGWVEDKQKQKSYFDFIFFESERLSRLISNVLQLSRLSNRESKNEWKEYSAKDLVDLIVSKVKTQIENAQFDFEVIGIEKLPKVWVRADEDSLVQIFINLIDNAIKFSAKAERKRIEIRGSVEGDPAKKLCISVRDYGPGVPKDQADKIFELFYRAEDELTRTTPGTGIGLALVRQLAEKMEARVRLKTPLDNGAEFEIVFPIVEVPHKN